MPNITMTIPDVAQTVSRPVMYSIIEQIQEITKIDKKAKIFYPGDINKKSTSGSTIDGDDRSAIFNTERIVFIEVEENFDLTAIANTAVTREEHIPVFVDSKLGVRVTPVYATSDVVINFKYRSPSKTEAQRWMDDMRTRVSMLRDINIHNVQYSYLLPTPVLETLADIFEKRETVSPYGQNIVDYITGCSTDRLTLLGDLTGSKGRLGVAETQARIVGIYGFEGVPEKPERNDDNGTWTISFSYKFSYERPVSCNMKYPIMVHNQLLKPEHIEFTNGEPDLNKVNKVFSKSLYAFNAFESDTIINSRHNPELVVRIPEYDDMVTENVPNYTGTVMWILTEIDLTDKRTLVNLTELGDYTFDDDIIAFMKAGEYAYMTSFTKSILHVRLYKDSYGISDGAITIDKDLNVVATIDLDPRVQHRLRIAIVTDFTLISKPATNRLQASPKAFVKLIGSINELLRNHPNFLQLSTLPVVHDYHYSEVYRLLTGFDNVGGGNSSGNVTGPGYTRAAMFGNIDPRVIQQSQNSRVSPKTVMVSNILSASSN